jgi:hypothetical protein
MVIENKEKSLTIVDLDIIWLFLVDLKDWISDVPKAGRSVYHTELADAMIIYHSAQEKTVGIGEIMLKDEALKDELKVILEADQEVIDTEYIENQRFIRLKLKEFKADIKELGERRVRVDLSLHRSGIGVLAMNVSLNGVNLTPSDIIDLELLPRSKKTMKFLLPPEVIREYSKVDKEVASALKGLPTVRRGLPLEASLDEVVWYYWSSIMNAIWKLESKEKILNSLRYEIFTAYPVVFIKRTSPEYETPAELLRNHPKQVYGILTQVLRQPIETVTLENVEKILGDDLSERADVSIFIALESTLSISSKDTWSVLKVIAEKRNTPIEYEYMYDMRTLLNVIELLQVQRQILWLYDYILASCPVESLSPRKLAQMKGEIARAVDEFYNIKVAAQREAWTKIEYGKKVFMIADFFNTVTGKLSLLDEAANSLHTTRMEALGLALTVLLSVIPLIFEFPMLIIVIGVIVVFAAYLLSGVLWKLRRFSKV